MRVAGVCGAGVCDAGEFGGGDVCGAGVSAGQPAGRWRAAGRIGLEHCDAGAGTRWFGARSLLDRGAGAQRYAESGVVQPSVWCRCGVVPVVSAAWRAMVRCCVVLGCGDEGAGVHSLGEGCLGGRDGGGRD
jgi:hypothetical protein